MSYTISPYDNRRMTWDAFMLVLVIYSCLTGAYDCAFNEDADVRRPSTMAIGASSDLSSVPVRSDGLCTRTKLISRGPSRRRFALALTGPCVFSSQPSTFSYVVDLCFYADILINFWTGFDNGALLAFLCARDTRACKGAPRGRDRRDASHIECGRCLTVRRRAQATRSSRTRN